MRYLGPIRDNGIGVRCPWVEGVPLYYYGHSFTMFPAPYNTPYTGEAGPRLQQMLNFGKGYFRGRSGTPLIEQISCILSDNSAPPSGDSGSRRWIPGSKGVILLQHYMNEIGGGMYTSEPLHLQHWGNTLRTEMALMSSESVITSTQATRTGTWTQLVTGSEWFYGDQVWFSSTVGSRVTFTVPSGDECWILLANSQSGYNTGAARILVGPSLTQHSVITTQGKMAQFTANSLPGTPLRNYGPAAYRINNLNALAGTSGSKQVVVEVTEAKNTFVSACFLSSTKPPRIFYGFEPPRADVADTNPSLDASRRAAFKAKAEEIIAEFPNAYGVDLAPGWNRATMVGSKDAGSNFHPGDYGMQHIASRYAEAIIATIRGPIDGVQVN